jgi:hypothetical protein
MEEAQTIRRRRPIISGIVIARRQNLSEEEISFLYSVKEKGN